MSRYYTVYCRCYEEKKLCSEPPNPSLLVWDNLDGLIVRDDLTGKVWSDAMEALITWMDSYPCEHPDFEYAAGSVDSAGLQYTIEDLGITLFPKMYKVFGPKGCMQTKIEDLALLNEEVCRLEKMMTNEHLLQLHEQHSGAVILKRRNPSYKTCIGKGLSYSVDVSEAGFEIIGHQSNFTMRRKTKKIALLPFLKARNYAPKNKMLLRLYGNGVPEPCEVRWDVPLQFEKIVDLDELEFRISIVQASVRELYGRSIDSLKQGIEAAMAINRPILWH